MLPWRSDPGRWLRCRYLFVEYGPMELDLNLRVRVHELQGALMQQARWARWACLPQNAPCSSIRHAA